MIAEIVNEINVASVASAFALLFILKYIEFYPLYVYRLNLLDKFFYKNKRYFSHIKLLFKNAQRICKSNRFNKMDYLIF